MVNVILHCDRLVLGRGVWSFNCCLPNTCSFYFDVCLHFFLVSLVVSNLWLRHFLRSVSSAFSCKYTQDGQSRGYMIGLMSNCSRVLKVIDIWLNGNRSFRTQVISYPSHFVPFWSYRTHFYFQFGHFVPSSVISYPVLSFHTYFYYFLEKMFWSFRTYFLLFLTQVISYPKLFRTHFSHFVPRSFCTHCQTRYELTWVRNDYLYCCNLLLPD